MTSYIDVIILPLSSVIPENTTLVIPDPPEEVSIMLKLFDGLLSVLGVWKMPFMNRIPFLAVVPKPTVFAPPTVNVKVLPIPVNLSEISSYILFVV